jgi:hypothetical protein
MANDEHVALLKQGVTAWNPWRNENQNILPDLVRADLHKANLRGANLMGRISAGRLLHRRPVCPQVDGAGPERKRSD